MSNATPRLHHHGGGGTMIDFARRMGGRLKTTFAVVGVASLAAAYFEYKSLTNKEKDGSKKKKQVLVLPFHRLQLVEKKDADVRSQFARISAAADQDDPNSPIVMEVRELVELLHRAAADPNIVALYGVFGGGSSGGLDKAGWADLEEVRTALRVVRESHRQHASPNVQHAAAAQVMPRIIAPKPLYAYGDSFGATDPANKEYYLASMFTHVHMQQQGELNLFGLLSTQFFLRKFLEKYGVVFHVSKHGEYKNATNMFTEARLTQAHRENVTNLVENINSSVCLDIATARAQALLPLWLQKDAQHAKLMWKQIHEAGTFSGLAAWKGGFIDHLPHRDPLPALLQYNQAKEKANPTPASAVAANDQWATQETDFTRFPANEVISLEKYAQQQNKQKKVQEGRDNWKQKARQYPRLASLWATVTGTADTMAQNTANDEQIALLYVTGIVDDKVARKLVHAIRTIRDKHNDTAAAANKTKCVVVRVSSPGGGIVACEAIHQELKALSIPVVFSFGNVSASGGYYIASSADRIFASPKTATGSIGVFGVRVDLRGLAAQYGINTEHVTAGNLAASYSPFHPMTRKMKDNMARSIDQYYAQFKQRVAEGRNLPIDYVEHLGRGRVWTGNQAKANGLVDELGGLHRAIAYACRAYTSSGDDTKVVVYPKQRSFFEKLADAREQADATQLRAAIFELLTGSPEHDTLADASLLWKPSDFLLDRLMHDPALPGTLASAMMVTDENTAVRCLLDSCINSQSPLATISPKSVFGVI